MPAISLTSLPCTQHPPIGHHTSQACMPSMEHARASSANAYDASAEALDKWSAEVAQRRQRGAATPQLSCSDSVPPGQMSKVSMLSINSPEDAKRFAERLINAKNVPHTASNESAARLTAEQILAELNAQDEDDAKARSAATISLASNLVHQVHSIPVRSPRATPQRGTPLPPPATSAAHLAALPKSPQPPRCPGPPQRFPMRPPAAPAWTDSATWRQALGVGQALADEDFNEDYVRAKALEVLGEYRAFREGVDRREQRYEEELLGARGDIAALEGRVAELQRQLHAERMRSDAILQEDPDGPTYRRREKSQLKAKLREVIAVHEVLQWQLHEKEKEMRVMEDIVKAHLLLHPAPAKPLRLLLSRRLPAFLERVQQGLPVMGSLRDPVTE